MPTPPDATSLAHLLSAASRLTRRVDIYEEDGTTPFLIDAPIVDGSVTISATRQERRMFSLTLANDDGRLDNHPGGLWYDKVVRIFSGISHPDGGWETQVGEFLIDAISQPHHPPIVQVSGRDFTRKLLVSKFRFSTSFAAGQAPEAIIKAIATNGGIDKFLMPTTGKTTGKVFSFERGVERWAAMGEIATAYGYELFFDAQGYLVMQERRDPVLSPEAWTFRTGLPDGTLVSFEKATNQNRLYNVVVVTGESTNGGLPVFAVAENREPTSPTSIDRLNEERIYQYVSSFITTEQQAQDVADKFLKVHALEQYDLRLESIALPWLDVGTIVRFEDPDPNPGQPDRFLLTELNLPLGYGAMSGEAKRVTVVG